MKEDLSKINWGVKLEDQVNDQWNIFSDTSLNAWKSISQDEKQHLETREST